MNELYGSPGRVDRPGESAEVGGAGRDVTYAPRHAGLDSHEMSRDEAYGEGGPGGSVDGGRDSGGAEVEGAAAAQGEGAAAVPVGAGDGNDDGDSGADSYEAAGPVADGAGLAGIEEGPGASSGVGGGDGAEPGADFSTAGEGTRGWTEEQEVPGPAVTRDDGRGRVVDVPGRGIDAPAAGARDAQPDGHERAAVRDAGEGREAEGADGSGRDSRSDGDGARGEGTAAESEAESEGPESAEPKQKARIREQDPVPDGVQETGPEAGANQQPDLPGLSPMEQFKAELKADLKAEIKEELRSEIEAELREELRAELKAEVKAEADSRRADTAEGQPDQRAEPGGLHEDSESSESLRTPDVIGFGEDGDDPGVEEADIAAFDNRGDGRDSREVNEAPKEPERHGFSEETAQAGQDALSLAGSLGVVNPLVALAVSADSARRKFQKMSPPDQLDVINLADTATKAFGSMPPGTAVVAVTLATGIPVVRDKARDLIHHFRRKD